MVRITSLNSLGFFFLDFLIPFVASLEIEATGREMGLIFSIRTIGYFLLAPLAGSLSDKISSKLLILLGSIGRGLAYFLLYISIIRSSLFIMVSGNFLLGFMAGFFWIPLDVLISQKSNKNNRSEAFGRRDAAIGQGTFIGASLGFGSLSYFNVVYPGNDFLSYSALLLFGIANLIAGVIFYTTIDESQTFSDLEHEKNSVSYIGFLTSLNKPFLLALILVFSVLLLSATNASIAKPFIIVYLTTNIESDPSLASVAFLPAGIVSLLLAPKLGALADRFNHKVVISIGAIFGSVSTWFLINTSSLLIFSFFLVIDFTVATTAGLIIRNILSRISVQNRGKIFGLQTLFMDFGAIVGPLLGGVFWDSFGQKAPFIFSIFVELSLIPFYILAIHKINPHFQEDIFQSFLRPHSP